MFIYSSSDYFLLLPFFAAGFFAAAFFAGAAFFLAAGLAAFVVSVARAGPIVTISGAAAPVRGPSVVASLTTASFDIIRWLCRKRSYGCSACGATNLTP